MKFHKTKFLAMFILCCAAAGFSVPNDIFEQRIGKKYILKRNLILFAHLTKIFPDNIIFTEGCNAARLTGREHYLIYIALANTDCRP